MASDFSDIKKIVLGIEAGEADLVGRANIFLKQYALPLLYKNTSITTGAHNL